MCVYPCAWICSRIRCGSPLRICGTFHCVFNGQCTMSSLLAQSSFEEARGGSSSPASPACEQVQTLIPQLCGLCCAGEFCTPVRSSRTVFSFIISTIFQSGKSLGLSIRARVLRTFPKQSEIISFVPPTLRFASRCSAIRRMGSLRSCGPGRSRRIL